MYLKGIGETLERERRKKHVAMTLLTELVARYSRRLKDTLDEYGYHYPNNWFGLQQIDCEMLDSDTGTFRYTYRMDVDLCDVLNVPEATTCHVVIVDDKLIKLHIKDFHHSSQELDMIEELLETVIPMLVIRNGYPLTH